MPVLVANLDAMGMARVKSRRVSVHQPRSDPGQMPAPGATARATGYDALKVAVKGDAPGGASDPASAGDAQFRYRQNPPMRRRPELERSDMAEWIKAASVGGDQCVRRKVMHDTCKVRRIVANHARIRQSPVRRQKILKHGGPHTRQEP